MPKKKSNVDTWIEAERKNTHETKALENASRNFDENDSFNVHTLEAIYGQESSFGKKRGERGSNNRAGNFQIEKATAIRMGLTVTKENDERFDVDQASDAASRYLKTLNHIFSKSSVLTENRTTIPVTDMSQRRFFVLAAFNAGEGRIAQAQMEAMQAEEDPANWSQVQNYLEQAGAPAEKAEEIREYVTKILAYEKEFTEKSPLKDLKQLEPTILKKQSKNGHWVTIDDHPVFIEDK